MTAETLQAAGFLVSAVAAMLAGLAAVIRARYWGKAHLLRAQRGDPEAPTPLVSLLRSRRDGRR